MVRDALASGGKFGMVSYPFGPHRAAPRHGVEVVIVECSTTVDGRMGITVKASRPFEIVSHSAAEEGYIQAEVKYKKWTTTPEPGETEAAEQLLEAVELWLRLVEEGGWERGPRHLEHIRAGIGSAPASTQPDECALWVAALINPLPGLGVAPEIRLSSLEAETTMERIAVVHAAVISSCQYMENGSLARLGVIWKRMRLVLVVTGLTWREFFTLSILVVAAFSCFFLPAVVDPEGEMHAPVLVAETPLSVIGTV